jgi:rod shape-determining protein MreC
VSRHTTGEFAQIDVVPAAQLASGHHVVVLFSDSLAMEQPHANR